MSEHRIKWVIIYGSDDKAIHHLEKNGPKDRVCHGEYLNLDPTVDPFFGILIMTSAKDSRDLLKAAASIDTTEHGRGGTAKALSYNTMGQAKRMLYSALSIVD